MNPNPTWSFKPGFILRICEDVTVVDEDNEIVALSENDLLMTVGAGMFVFMKTSDTFRVDELDARIIELSAELLCT